MAYTLSDEQRDNVRDSFLTTKSVKATVKQTGVSRNAVRTLLRQEGLCEAPHLKIVASDASEPVRSKKSAVGDNWKGAGFSYLEQFFKLAGDRPETLDFTTHVKRLTETMAEELGVTGSTLDTFKLELAVTEWIQYRRCYLRSFQAADAQYEGPYAKHHDRVAKASLKWSEAGHRSLDNFLKIIRDLEVKNGKRLVGVHNQGTVMNNPQIQINNLG